MSVIIDARSAAESAIKILLKKKKQLELPDLQIQPLKDFLQEAEQHKLTKRDKQLICDQAILIMEQFYAHLPFKRARYAADPAQRLRLLRNEITNLSEQQFHAEMIRTFTELRDVHTLYRLPEPFKSAVAFLPFFTESFETPEGRRYVVTEIMEGFKPDPSFGHFVEIVSWSGVPIEKAVDQLARNIPGGNVATRVFRGNMRLTVRTLNNVLAPIEECAFIHYKPRGSDEVRILMVPWYAGRGLTTTILLSERSLEANAECRQLTDLAKVKDTLWVQRRLSIPVPASEKTNFYESSLPHVFEVHHTLEKSEFENWSEILTDSRPAKGKKPAIPSTKKFGYVRIYTFNGELGSIFLEFENILQWLEDNQFATHGLVLDIRSNGGGSITDAERMLQLLTAKRIEPALFQFPNTEAVQRVMAKLTNQETTEEARAQLVDDKKSSISKGNNLFKRWVDGILRGAASGSALTDGRPLTTPEEANNIGQVYQGPVTLLVDAGTYSASDIFAAGFQDHSIGPIIGTDDNTGGGGASVWTHGRQLEQIAALTELPLAPLPAGAGISLASLRSSRVKSKLGEPVEDIGVKCDIRHKLSLPDLMMRSCPDIMHLACQTLAKRPVYRLKILKAEVSLLTALKVTVKATANLERLVCYLEGQPQLVLQLDNRKSAGVKTVEDGLEMITESFSVPLVALNDRIPRELSIMGYNWNSSRAAKASGNRLELVASHKTRIKRIKV